MRKIALVIKYSGEKVSLISASCSRTIWMSVTTSTASPPYHHPTTTYYHPHTTTWLSITTAWACLTRSTLELLAEHEKLHLIVDGQDTSAGNTTENVGTSTLEERSNTLLGNDLTSGIEGTLVLDGLTRSHHHTTTDGIQRIRSNTSTSRNCPTEKEGGQEIVLKRTDEEDGLNRVVHTKVQTTVDDYTKNRGCETTVETGNTIRGESLLIHIDQTVVLTGATSLGILVVVGQTGTGVVEGVDEQKGSSTSGLSRSASSKIPRIGCTYTTRRQVAHHPFCVSIAVLLVGEHGLVSITESEVKSLRGEVTDNIGSVTTPQRCNTLLRCGSAEALNDTIVLAIQTARLYHLILFEEVSTSLESKYRMWTGAQMCKVSPPIKSRKFIWKSGLDINDATFADRAKIRGEWFETVYSLDFGSIA